MAKTTRGKDKRTMAHAHAGVTRAVVHLGKLEKRFATAHKSYAEYLQLMCVLLGQVLEMIDEFSDKAWGGHPSDYETWRNLTRRNDPKDYDNP